MSGITKIFVYSLRSELLALLVVKLPEGEGGYFSVKDYWGCAAGWGRIFTTGLTIMGLHFQ